MLAKQKILDNLCKRLPGCRDNSASTPRWHHDTHEVLRFIHSSLIPGSQLRGSSDLVSSYNVELGGWPAGWHNKIKHFPHFLTLRFLYTRRREACCLAAFVWSSTSRCVCVHSCSVFAYVCFPPSWSHWAVCARGRGTLLRYTQCYHPGLQLSQGLHGVEMHRSGASSQITSTCRGCHIPRGIAGFKPT